MTPADHLWINAATAIALMTGVWSISVLVRNASIIDIAWGPGFAIIAWISFGLDDPAGISCWLLPALATAWGLRLGVYLASRNLGKAEDFRYRAMRDHHGSAFAWKSWYRVFQLQAAIMWVVSLPLQMGVAHSARDWQAWHVIGIVVWAIGFLFESIGDFQLARFKRIPENDNRVMDRGLWRYTRHPNYFGDFLVWWGLWLVAAAEPAARWTIISPVIMSIFLLRISGVPMLESALRKTKDGYTDYVKRTRAFFPWRPRA
tara:strand:- start:307 stop:1086 length:780 start_codon:yes stop_codon:yes gene_type:complete